MLSIILATGNAHKKKEITGIMPGIRFSLPADHGIVFDVPEDGETFHDNALLKARWLYDRLKLPVLSDDSGLCVRGLGGGPGIYSARYGSPPGGANLPAADRNRYLLSKLEGVEDRRAVFVCCMVLILDEYRIFSIQEKVEGVIAGGGTGTGGFGYDPVFYMPEYGKTMAELGEKEKNRISHRGRAGSIMLGIIRDVETGFFSGN